MEQVALGEQLAARCTFLFLTFLFTPYTLPDLILPPFLSHCPPVSPRNFPFSRSLISPRLIPTSPAPEFYVASAISFYKALKVYPSPQELLMIYQKTQPQPVFDLVMELISLEISDAQASGAFSAGGLRSEDPLLEEIEAGEKQAQEDEEEDEEEIVVGGSSSGPKSVSSDGASPSSGNSSFVHVESSTPAAVEKSAEKVVDSAEEVVAEVVEKVEEAVRSVEESVEEKKEEFVQKAAEGIEEAKVEDPEEPVLA